MKSTTTPPSNAPPCSPTLESTMSKHGTSTSLSEPAPPQQESYYRVFKPERDTAAHDPLDPVKRYDDGVFVEVNPEASAGTLFHVTGGIIAASGMRYEERNNYDPTESGHLHRTTQIGWVLKPDYNSGRISSILRALPTPSKQQGLNFWERNPDTGKYDIIWTREDGERYAPVSSGGRFSSVVNGRI